MNPGSLFPVSRLEGADFVIALQRLRDFVEPTEKPFTATRVDLKTMGFPRGRGDGLRLQIDSNPPRPLRALDVGGKPVDDLLVDDDGKDAVLKAVGEENIAKAGADDGAAPHLLPPPPRPFARGAAAEIRSRHQDFRVSVRLAVEDELRILGTVRQIAQRTKGPFAERAANRISDQALYANDDIRIDIAAHDRCGDRVQFVEGFWHVSAPWSARRQSCRQSRSRRRSPGSPDGCGRAVPGGR